MKNTVMVKQTELGQIRFIDLKTPSINGVWFVGKDVANCLQYTNTNLTLKRFVSDSNKILLSEINSMGIKMIPIEIFDSRNHSRDFILINQYGFYELALHSRMPEAKRFQKVICNEVIPSAISAGITSDAFNNNGIVMSANIDMMGDDKQLFMDKMNQYARTHYGFTIAQSIGTFAQIFNRNVSAKLLHNGFDTYWEEIEKRGLQQQAFEVADAMLTEKERIQNMVKDYQRLQKEVVQLQNANKSKLVRIAHRPTQEEIDFVNSLTFEQKVWYFNHY